MGSSSGTSIGDRSVPIGDLTIHDVGFDETTRRIADWAAARSGGYVCTPNVDYVVRSRRDTVFRRAIQAARLRVPDGMWMVYASRLAGRGLRGTVTGRLLLPSVAEIAAREDLGIGLFGAAPGVANRVRSILERNYPGVRVVVAITPPTPFEIGSPADQQAVAELRAASPDVVFVALGAPKQEIWMQRHAAELGGAVSVGVGAAFDIMAGRFREAPRWMTRYGFEWLFRLAQEPRRLARRYLLDDPWILYWALRTRLARRDENADQRPDAAS
jgi:N-acetylglucosaminyldiphosphoundecaprenol N-acetyl-beta-D-mannosaminyltransferase